MPGTMQSTLNAQGVIVCNVQIRYLSLCKLSDFPNKWKAGI